VRGGVPGHVAGVDPCSAGGRSLSLFGGMWASEFHTGVAEQASDHSDQLRELGRRCRRWARWPQDRYAISVGVSDQLNRQ
jgi:hypothetical protein